MPSSSPSSWPCCTSDLESTMRLPTGSVQVACGVILPGSLSAACTLADLSYRQPRLVPRSACVGITHTQSCSCMCASGMHDCEVGSPGRKLRISPSHREKGSRAQGFSREHQRKLMFQCCCGDSCPVLPSPLGQNLGFLWQPLAYSKRRK